MNVSSGEGKQQARTMIIWCIRWTRVAVIAVVVLLVLYLVGLFNPLTGPWFQYPYYKMACGKGPIVATSIMGKSYYTPT